MNKVSIIGNLTKDPVTHTTQEGKTVCTFTVAVNRRQTVNAGQPDADFFRVSAWGEMGQNCQKYLMKGKKVAVYGRISGSAYTTPEGEPRANLDVFAQEVEFLTPKDSPSAVPVKKDDGYVKVEEELPF